MQRWSPTLEVPTRKAVPTTKLEATNRSDHMEEGEDGEEAGSGTPPMKQRPSPLAQLHR